MDQKVLLWNKIPQGKRFNDLRACFERGKYTPRLQFKPAQIHGAVMLALLVDANVALEGSSVRGPEVGSWYYWLRPFVQPLFILWALFVSGVIWQQRPENDARLANRPSSSPSRPQVKIKSQ